MDRRRDAGKSSTNFSNLRALSATAPRTKSGRIRWAWPQIQASLGNGRKMHEIWEALQRDGIEVSYGQFRTYIWRIRKQLASRPELMPPSPNPAPSVNGRATPLIGSWSGTPSIPPDARRDPLANIRREQEKKRTSGFTYNPVSGEDE